MWTGGRGVKDRYNNIGIHVSTTYYFAYRDRDLKQLCLSFFLFFKSNCFCFFPPGVGGGEENEAVNWLRPGRGVCVLSSCLIQQLLF